MHNRSPQPPDTAALWATAALCGLVLAFSEQFSHPMTVLLLASLAGLVLAWRR